MNRLVLLLLPALLLAGCSGVNSYMRVETRGLPPDFGLAIANSADAVQEFVHETLVGDPGYGRFSRDVRIKVDERSGRTSVYTNRNWSAR